MRDQLIGLWFGASASAKVEGKAYGVIQTSALQPVVSAFDKNAAQAAFISKFPQEMCIFGQRLKLAEIDASIQVRGDPHYPGRCRVRLKSEEPNEEAERRDRAEMKAIESLASDILAGRADHTLPAHFGADSVQLASHATDELRAAYDTLMSAQLVLAWTAFETLAGDLWEAAVNAHPQMLASLTGMKNSATKDEGKRLPMSYLERHHYDLRGKMGTVLREHRCRFTTLDDIITSYRLAFPERSDLNSEKFWGDQDVKTTAAVRNLIVHKAGMVDDEFIRQTSHDDRMSAWKVGEQYHLDGRLLQQLLRGLLGFCAGLIRSVDDWIVNNPT